MNEFSVTVVSDDEAHLEPAVLLCFADRPAGKGLVTYFRTSKGRIDLLRISTQDATPLPYAMGPEEAVSFLKGWLRRLDKTTGWEREPDTDGTTKRGWRVTTDGLDWLGGVSMRTEWIVYGK